MDQKILRKLTKNEIADLIRIYKSDIRKFRLIISNLRYHVRELNAYLDRKSSTINISESRNSGLEVSSSHMRKRGPQGPRPLNEWDQTIYDIISEATNPYVTNDIFKRLRRWAKIKNLYESDNELKARINQSLVKLIKRNIIEKLPHKGRGFSYKLKNP